jgi:hypothetical protein
VATPNPFDDIYGVAEPTEETNDLGSPVAESSQPAAPAPKANPFDDIYGVASPVEAPEAPPPESFVGNITDLASQSGTQLKANLSSYLLTGQWDNLDDDTRRGLTEAMAAANEFHKKPEQLEQYLDKIGTEMQDVGTAWEQGDYVTTGIQSIDFVAETIWEGVTNPKGFSYMVAEQGANLAATMGGGWAGGKVGGASGAAIGSAVPGAGTAVGGVVGSTLGFALGAGATGYLIETGAQIREFINEQGGDPADPEAVYRALNNPELREDMLDKASKKGLSIAMFDAAATMLGIKLLKGIKGPVSAALRSTGALGAQVGGAFGGEVLGQTLATGEVNWRDVGAEVALEIGPGGLAEPAVGAWQARGYDPNNDPISDGVMPLDFNRDAVDRALFEEANSELRASADVARAEIREQEDQALANETKSYDAQQKTYPTANHAIVAQRKLQEETGTEGNLWPVLSNTGEWVLREDGMLRPEETTIEVEEIADRGIAPIPEGIEVTEEQGPTEEITLEEEGPVEEITLEGNKIYTGGKKKDQPTEQEWHGATQKEVEAEFGAEVFDNGAQAKRAVDETKKRFPSSTVEAILVDGEWKVLPRGRASIERVKQARAEKQVGQRPTDSQIEVEEGEVIDIGEPNPGTEGIEVEEIYTQGMAAPAEGIEVEELQAEEITLKGDKIFTDNSKPPGDDPPPPSGGGGVTAEIDRVKKKVENLTSRTLKTTLKDAGMKQSGSREDMIDRVVTGREAVETIGKQYKTQREIMDAALSGEIDKETLYRLAKAVAPGNKKVDKEATWQNGRSLSNWLRKVMGESGPPQMSEADWAQHRRDRETRRQSDAATELQQVKDRLDKLPRNFNIDEVEPSQLEEVNVLRKRKRDLTDQIDEGTTREEIKAERERLVQALFKAKKSTPKDATIAELRDLLGKEEGVAGDRQEIIDFVSSDRFEKADSGELIGMLQKVPGWKPVGTTDNAQKRAVLQEYAEATKAKPSPPEEVAKRKSDEVILSDVEFAVLNHIEKMEDLRDAADPEPQNKVIASMEANLETIDGWKEEVEAGDTTVDQIIRGLEFDGETINWIVFFDRKVWDNATKNELPDGFDLYKTLPEAEQAFGREFMERTTEHEALDGTRVLQNPNNESKDYAEIRIIPFGREGKILVEEIHSSRPKMGSGDAALNLLIDLADKHGVELILDPIANGDPGKGFLNQEMLVSWYKRKGFEDFPDFGDMLIYKPRKKGTVLKEVSPPETDKKNPQVPGRMGTDTLPDGTEYDLSKTAETQIATTQGTYDKVYEEYFSDVEPRNLLDYGAGKGLSAKAHGFESLEPYPRGWTPTYQNTDEITRKYPAIIANNILNVLPKHTRRAVLWDVGQKLENGGRAYFNVRSRSDINKTSGIVTKFSDGEVLTSRGTYQKGFQPQELINFIQAELGPDYTVERAQFGSVSVIVTKKTGSKEVKPADKGAESFTVYHGGLTYLGEVTGEDKTTITLKLPGGTVVTFNKKTKVGVSVVGLHSDGDPFNPAGFQLDSLNDRYAAQYPQSKKVKEYARKETTEKGHQKFADRDEVAGKQPGKGDLAAMAAAMEEPKSEAQMEAGNYKKGHEDYQGLGTSWETKPGQERVPGKKSVHFVGDIKGTIGADGDAVDVILNKDNNPNADSPVYIVNAKNPKTGKFDEHKVMLGFGTKALAQEGYLGTYDANWLSSIHLVPRMSEFKLWLKHGDTKSEFDPKAWAGQISLIRKAQRKDGIDQLKEDESNKSVTYGKSNERNLKARLHPDPTKDDLFTFMRKSGGFSEKLVKDHFNGRDLKYLNKTIPSTRIPGLPSIEQKGDKGLDLEGAVTAAWEAEYITDNDEDQFFEAMSEAEGGEFYSQQNSEYMEAEAEAYYQEQLDREAGEWSAFTDASPEFNETAAETTRLYVQAKDINEDAADDILGKDIPEADVQAQLRDLINGTPETEANNTEESARETRGTDEGEQAASLGGQGISAIDLTIPQREWNKIVNHWESLFDVPGERVRHTTNKEYITEKEAEAIRQEWYDEVDRQRDEHSGENASKGIVLSLFDYTGAWAQPWAEAGYDVRLIDLETNGVDIMDIDAEWLIDNGMEDAYIVLAACPCTDFSSAGARWMKGKDASGQTQKSVDLVNHTMEIISWLQPRFWAIENPVGRIGKLTNLPKNDGKSAEPRLAFHPHNYGDPYTKQTLLWGNFNPNLPQTNVEPTEGSYAHKLRGDVPEQKRARSDTFEGFAFSFFMANNDQQRAPEYIRFMEGVVESYKGLDDAQKELVRRAYEVGAHDGLVDEDFQELQGLAKDAYEQGYGDFQDNWLISGDSKALSDDEIDTKVNELMEMIRSLPQETGATGPRAVMRGNRIIVDGKAMSKFDALNEVKKTMPANKTGHLHDPGMFSGSEIADMFNDAYPIAEPDSIEETVPEYDTADIDSVLEASAQSEGGETPLEDITLVAEDGNRVVSHNAKWWKGAIDDRLKKLNKMRGCA